jgi:hypothetical protein
LSHMRANFDARRWLKLPKQSLPSCAASPNIDTVIAASHPESRPPSDQTSRRGRFAARVPAESKPTDLGVHFRPPLLCSRDS